MSLAVVEGVLSCSWAASGIVLLFLVTIHGTIEIPCGAIEEQKEHSFLISCMREPPHRLADGLAVLFDQAVGFHVAEVALGMLQGVGLVPKVIRERFDDL